MKKVITIAEYTRFYYGESESKFTFYTDWCSFEKTLELIGEASFKIQSFIAYYREDNPPAEAEFIIGERVSEGMEQFTGWISGYRLKKFIDEKELGMDVNDFTFVMKDGLMFDSGHVGECRIIFKNDDMALLCSILQKLDAPKSVFHLLLNNKGSLAKVYPNGKVHSLEKIDSFSEYWNLDFFERFTEVKG